MDARWPGGPGVDVVDVAAVCRRVTHGALAGAVADFDDSSGYPSEESLGFFGGEVVGEVVEDDALHVDLGDRRFSGAKAFFAPAKKAVSERSERRRLRQG